MNRYKLFLSAFVLGSTLAGPMLGAPPRSANKATPKVPAGNRGATTLSAAHAHPEAKCGRCGTVGGRGSGPATNNKKALDTGHLHPAGNEVRRPDGGRNSFGRDGHVLEGHYGRTDLHRGPDGRREVRVERADHSVLVASRGGHGYIERRYSYHGHEFEHRTFYEHGVAYRHFYQPYYYRGIAFHVYAPGFYYAPAFYGWAYNPWAAPVAWSWGWAGDPWYRYYGAWFTPYPVYSSPALWLTDYLMAQTLQAAYEERIAAARSGALAAQANSTPMTPEVKQAIAAEVRRQIALENAEAAQGSQNPPDPAFSGLARMLNDRTAHVFVAATDLDVMSGSGECPIAEGDVMELNGQTASNAVNANLVVLASKGNDCRKGSIVTVGSSELFRGWILTLSHAGRF